MDEAVHAAIDYFKKVADRFGYVLNPNATVVQRLARQMSDYKRRHSHYFCPCKQHYPLEPAGDPHCPCDTFQQEIAHMGHCECFLFFDIAASVQAKRRPGLLATVTCPG